MVLGICVLVVNGIKVSTMTFGVVTWTTGWLSTFVLRLQKKKRGRESPDYKNATLRCATARRRTILLHAETRLVTVDVIVDVTVDVTVDLRVV